MARIKNALTGYFIGDLANAGENPDYAALATLELAHYISTVTDDSDETTEETGYYDGDGTPETDVTTIKKSYGFEGFYDDSDPAMAYVAGLEMVSGDKRKVAFKQVRTDGTIYSGRGTVSAIKTTGGEATEFAPFSCTISFDTLPLKTEPVDPPEVP